MSTTSENQKSPKPWKRFLLGFFSPALLLVATLVFFSPDFLEWTYPIVLGLAVLVGLIAGFKHKKWAFFLGVITAFATSILAVVVIEWMKY